MIRFRFFVPALIFALILLPASGATLYVSLNSANPMTPYSDWSIASTNIQDAVDAANPGDVVLVSNGVYQTGQTPTPLVWDGGTTSNRVTISKPIVVQSVKGPAVTIIQGYQLPGTITGSGAIRCVFLTNDAVLDGFTLQYGATESGDTAGGIQCRSNSLVRNCLIVSNSAAGGVGAEGGGTLTNCTLSGNSSIVNSGYVQPAGGGALDCTLINCLILSNSVVGPVNTIFGGNNVGPSGGGAAFCTLINCVLSGNHSDYEGGGTYGCRVVNCTYVGNSATNAGGAFGTAITNSIFLDNVAPVNPDFEPQMCTLVYCRVANLPPLPSPYFINNITNAPQFVNEAGGDYHLLPTSPCINSGNNAYVATGADLEGNPRISGGTVDIGCYEYQNPASVISYAWLQQYALPADGTADFTDPDSDGMSNYAEWRAGTDPTYPMSVLKMLCVSNSPTGATVTWRSAPGIIYYLQSTTNLSIRPFTSIQSNLVGQAGSTNYFDANATNGGSVFYRVGVQ